MYAIRSYYGVVMADDIHIFANKIIMLITAGSAKSAADFGNDALWGGGSRDDVAVEYFGKTAKLQIV